VAVVAAGTSDLPVVHECAATVRVFAAEPDVIVDVGVAGLHRLLGQAGRIAAADAVVAVAGMEAALPSVLGGLVGVPLIAVPTSVGYGWNLDGLSAWLACVNSCAPGVLTVNVDNGFGPGAAARIRPGRPRVPAAPGGAGQRGGPVKTLWVDASNGAAGDMLLAALLDAGADLDAVRTGAAGDRRGAGGPDAERGTPARLKGGPGHGGRPRQRGHAQPARCRLDPVPGRPARQVQDFAVAVFQRLARAEAGVHGVAPDEIGFHEVGALDAIADVAGCALALHSLGLLQPCTRVVSPVAAGSGSVRDGPRHRPGSGASGAADARRRHRPAERASRGDGTVHAHRRRAAHDDRDGLGRRAGLHRAGRRDRRRRGRPGRASQRAPGAGR
jgi:NCAIR mutase (PurE)-related proteins